MAPTTTANHDGVTRARTAWVDLQLVGERVVEVRDHFTDVAGHVETTVWRTILAKAPNDAREGRSVLEIAVSRSRLEFVPPRVDAHGVAASRSLPFRLRRQT